MPITRLLCVVLEVEKPSTIVCEAVNWIRIDNFEISNFSLERNKPAHQCQLSKDNTLCSSNFNNDIIMAPT